MFILIYMLNNCSCRRSSYCAECTWNTGQKQFLTMICAFLRTFFDHLPPVSLIPVVHLDSRISPRIFENGLNGILWGGGETDSWKKPDAKNHVTLSLLKAVILYRIKKGVRCWKMKYRKYTKFIRFLLSLKKAFTIFFLKTFVLRIHALLAYIPVNPYHFF